MASDTPPGISVQFGDNTHMCIAGSDEKKLREYFDKLTKGGKVNMPLEKQFWGDIFGMFTDKFGVHWMVNISAKKT
jgi:PhnB protein